MKKPPLLPNFAQVFMNPILLATCYFSKNGGQFLTHFWPLLPKRKREYIMTKPCILNIFVSPLSIYKVKITLPCTENPIWRILLKKLPKICNSFFSFFFFKLIKHNDLFQTMDKRGQNSWSLWKKNFGPAPYIISFPKWRKTMEIWKIGVFSWHF